MPRFLLRNEHEGRATKHDQGLVMQLVWRGDRAVLRFEYEAAQPCLGHNIRMTGDIEAPVSTINARVTWRDRSIGKIDIYFPSISRLRQISTLATEHIAISFLNGPFFLAELTRRTWITTVHKPQYSVAEKNWRKSNSE